METKTAVGLLLFLIVLGVSIHQTTTADVEKMKERDSCVVINEELLLCKKWGKTQLSDIYVADILNGTVIVEKQ